MNTGTVQPTFDLPQFMSSSVLWKWQIAVGSRKLRQSTRSGDMVVELFALKLEVQIGDTFVFLHDPEVDI